MSNSYRMCTRCVMDNKVDETIVFNEIGICNHCIRYDELLNTRVFRGAEGEKALSELVSSIKEQGSKNKYDCLIGVSGGVDSTYVAYLVKKLGLRPLAVHVDNGWNSSLAVQNIENLLEKLDIDLINYVVGTDEFKDLQLSFLKASVSDGEIPTDHAVSALLWQTANKYKIKYIISGMNFTTESISVPNWSYGHSDWRYIKDIASKHGSKKLKSYPHFGFSYLFYITFIKKIKSVSILNYIDYNKEEVMSFLEKELDWVYYGGKHYESNYTKFYQGYILPKKFGIDKRYGHLSDLINAGQLTREEALAELKSLPYDSNAIDKDKENVLKELNLSVSDFDRMMNEPLRSFKDYKNSYVFVNLLKKALSLLRRNNLYPK